MMCLHMVLDTQKNKGERNNTMFLAHVPRLKYDEANNNRLHSRRKQAGGDRKSNDKRIFLDAVRTGKLGLRRFRF